nr:HoxN/HupN/NixA family nickel/cobalt transporter [Thermoanaerobacterium butyriciformans]
MAFVSYTLGLNHAFDADHIAAIDNTARKLVEQKKNPKGVGFFFSTGHSSVVFLMTLITVFAVRWAQNIFPVLQRFGGILALTVSGVFLILIGLINFFIWLNTYKKFINIRRGAYKEESMEEILKDGFFNRYIRVIYAFINKSWHVYILGFFFGLGFDTATQIALLATAAGAASKAIPIVSILSFPILFAAGMSLMDTVDGFLVTSAYQWVFDAPLRKVYYNLVMTGLSVIAALLIGFVEITQLITQILGLSNGVWSFIQNLNFSTLGYIIVILFIFVWTISYVGWKLLRVGG